MHISQCKVCFFQHNVQDRLHSVPVSVTVSQHNTADLSDLSPVLNPYQNKTATSEVQTTVSWKCISVRLLWSIKKM